MSSPRITDREEHVKLVPNVPKIVSAISFVIAESQRLGQNFTQYQIVKALFFADKSHLNDYGRPITFDNYCAMYHGPVPSFAYDLLKGNSRAIQKTGGRLPWTMKKGQGSAFHYAINPSKCDFEPLSSSDKQALVTSIKTIKKLGFSGIRTLTHSDPAYNDAWRDEGGSNKSYPMNMALLFEKPNPTAIKNLSFLSQHQ